MFSISITSGFLNVHAEKITEANKIDLAERSLKLNDFHNSKETYMPNYFGINIHYEQEIR